MTNFKKKKNKTTKLHISYPSEPAEEKGKSLPYIFIVNNARTMKRQSDKYLKAGEMWCLKGMRSISRTVRKTNEV